MPLLADRLALSLLVLGVVLMLILPFCWGVQTLADGGVAGARLTGLTAAQTSCVVDGVVMGVATAAHLDLRF